MRTKRTKTTQDDEARTRKEEETGAEYVTLKCLKRMKQKHSPVRQQFDIFRSVSIANPQKLSGIIPKQMKVGLVSCIQIKSI